MVVILSAKNDEDPIKNKSARVSTTLDVNFSNTKGQVTLQSVMGFSRILNSFELLWLSFFLPRMTKIQSETKVLEC